MSNLIVQKYGGTSLANTERFQAVADIIVDSISSGDNVAVVVSAMAGETQRLIDLAKEMLDKFVKNTKREVSIDYIQKVVSEYFQMDVETLQSKTHVFFCSLTIARTH